MCMGIGSALGAGLGAASGIFGQRSAERAGDSMALGNLLAAQMQQQMFGQVAGALQPFIGAGTGAYDALMPLIGVGEGRNPLTAPLTRRFQPTMEELRKTPGYQFTLGEGLRSVQNSAAAKGLGSSSNALRGAADYASGLASNTFQQQLQNFMAQNQQTYNMLSGLGGTGLQAALGLGGVAGNFGNMIGSSLRGMGEARGTADMAGTNALFRGLGQGWGTLNANPPGFWNSDLSVLGGSLGGLMGWSPFPKGNYFG